MSVETASILSFATNGLIAPSKLAVPFPTATIAPTQTVDTVSLSTSTDRAQQAINAVKQASANARGLRKSLAGFRLQYAQAALKALMFFGGDPVMVARRAAQLAREVKAAAQEYVASGGDAADVQAQAQAATADANTAAAVPAQASTVASAATAPNGFSNDARQTLDTLKAIVARSQQQAKNDRQHRQAVASFKNAASDAGAAVGQASASTTPSFDTLNLLI